MSIRRPIKKILIANRGEIAVRIIRTCRELGLSTVAVFSDADRTAPHVGMADEACPIGPASAEHSYLNVDRLVDVARRTGCDAVHPGYGFRSESASFSRAFREAGIVFIGPPPEVLESVGDKTTARALMAASGVPVAPGSAEAVRGIQEARDTAEKLGYPVLVKAAAGGGGKGMRLVRSAAELASALEASGSEALSAFGDGRVFVEKLIEDARHVEIQILADEHGNVVHLFERDCSIQRRHQKVIEESPSPAVDDALREAMGAAGVKAARACGYVNAGTIEFLLADDGNFYFMEMNARLQVEHPVTEMITGLDLVAEQIRIASGEPLGYCQEDLTRSGHAIECRIYAEDPAADFLPDPGSILRHRPPLGPGLRVDAGVVEGGDVVVHYDPMISKIIAWAPDRARAIERMVRALREYEIAGVRTTIPFCQFVLNHTAFRDGIVSTRFVEEHFKPSVLRARGEDNARMAAVAAAFLLQRTAPPAAENGVDSSPKGTRWIARREFR